MLLRIAIFLSFLDFSIDVPTCFFQVFNLITLEPAAPKVFDSIANAETEVFDNVNALNA
jgi:hypothetical protein